MLASVQGNRAMHKQRTGKITTLGSRNASGVANREPQIGAIPTHIVGINPNISLLPGTAGSSSAPALLKNTGVRVLQQNMRRSRAVTGEIRKLIARKKLDVLLLQEVNARKQGKVYACHGLGLNVSIAATWQDRPWAAIALGNPGFQMLTISQLTTPHCACAEIRAPGFSFYAISCYFQYSDEIEGHLRHLEAVFHSLRGQRLIIGMDANARSPLWGDRKLDSRGVKLEEFIRTCGWKVLNAQGQPPTFWTAWGSSHIDVTLTSPNMSPYVGEWKVRVGWTTSDHNSLDIRLGLPKVKGQDQRSLYVSRFDVRRADWNEFAESLTDLSRSRLEALDLGSSREVESFAEVLSEVLIEASKRAMPRKRRFRRSNPWWTKELTILKKNVYRTRRAFQREVEESARLAKRQEYYAAWRKYGVRLRRTKRKSWQKFVTEVGNKEPWGFVYKHAAQKLKVDKMLSSLRTKESSTITLEETARRLLDVHVPEDRENEDTPEQREIRESAHLAPDTNDAPFFTEAEIVAVAKSLKPGKAPGLDLVEVAVVRAAIRTIPGQLVRLFNGCLQWGVFPSNWKDGSLRVFLKGEDKDVEDPKSYRPICLLSVVGKFLEKLLMERLTQTALSQGRLSDRQFGFMPGKSTEDAIVELRRMVSAAERRYVIALLFDITGAFDNVWWPLVLQAWSERDCPRNIFQVLCSYFSNRRVSISFGDICVSKEASRGCPQGSVLGPACWTVMFDGLLRELDKEIGRTFIAYADDLLVTVEGNSRSELEARGQRTVDIINEWCIRAKLQISSRKTEAIVIRSEPIRRSPIGRRGGERPDRKRKAVRAKKSNLMSRPPTIRLGPENKICFKKKVRYLGIHFEQEMGVSSHCKYLRGKVGPLFSKLARTAGCQWGLRFGALSTIYRGVFTPTVAYAAAGWADRCRESDLRGLRTLQRQALISTIAAYRTASTESLCVAAGAVPIDILLDEYKARYSARKEMDVKIGNAEIPFTGNIREAYKGIRDATLNMWQNRWSSSSHGRITYAFFKDVHDRVCASWVQPDHYVTQVLTGHGKFRGRLASLGLVESGMCACGRAEDTTSHHLTECPEFEPQREALREFVPADKWRWPEMAQFLVSTPEAYSAFAAFCKESLWLKGPV